MEHRVKMPVTRRLAKPRLITALAIAVLVAGPLATACAPRIDTRGNRPDPDALAEVRLGEYTRDDIMDILGSPSSTSSFGDRTWYYISKRTETTAFLAPEEAERSVVAIHFNDRGRVESIETLGLEDGNRIRVVERETPTSGHELTLIEQLFGNIGRFAGKK